MLFRLNNLDQQGTQHETSALRLQKMSTAEELGATNFPSCQTVENENMAVMPTKAKVKRWPSIYSL